MSHLMRGFVLAAGLGLMLGASGQAKAGLIFQAGNSTAQGAINVAINDLTDSITATIGGQAVSGLRVGELFTFTVPTALFFPSLNTASRDLLEPNGAFSDRLLVADGTGTGLLVSFASDPAVTLPGGTVFTPLTEDGTFQSMFYATATSLLGTTVAVVNFKVASDASVVITAIPEPSTIAMAAGAVPLALGFWWRKRRRATA
jgi:hypothetical protein